MRMSARRAGWKANLSLALASLVLAFVLPEMLLRVFHPSFNRTLFGGDAPNPQGLSGLISMTERYERAHGIRQPPNFIQPSDLLWSLVPGYRGNIFRLPPLAGVKPTWRLEVNELGLRGKPPTAGKRGLRVLCLGDSTTFGDKLDEGTTYPEVIERLLRERRPDRDPEVINAGVPGYSSHQGLALQRKLRELHPFVVVVAFGSNDTWLVATPDRENLPLDGSLLNRLRSRLRSTEVYRALRALLLEARRRVTPTPQPGTQPALLARVPLSETEQNVRIIVREARADSAEVIVLHTAFGHPEIAQVLARVARVENVPFIDGAAELEAAREQRQRALAARLGLKGACPDPGPVRSGYVLRVRMPDARRGATTIVATVGGVGPAALRVPLADDGRGCDERERDGVWTGVVAAPPGQLLSFVFEEPQPAGTRAGEFRDFPMALREARSGTAPAGGPLVGPVETYGRYQLMSEMVHPDAEGAAVLAAAVARVIR